MFLAKKFPFCKVCSGSHKRHHEQGATQCYQAFLVFQKCHPVTWFPGSRNVLPWEEVNDGGLLLTCQSLQCQIVFFLCILNTTSACATATAFDFIAEGAHPLFYFCIPNFTLKLFLYTWPCTTVRHSSRRQTRACVPLSRAAQESDAWRDCIGRSALIRTVLHQGFLLFTLSRWLR